MSVQRSPFLLASLFVSIGLGLGGFFISKTLYNAKVALNTAEAKGLAERRVKADRANWTIYFNVSGKKRSDVPALYKEAEVIEKRIQSLLTESGFTDGEISRGIINYSSKEFRDENQQLVDENHFLTGSISLETDKVYEVSPARGKVNSLVAEGIDITNSRPRYRFTKLNDIKPEMLREATKNARIAANEFASNAGVEVGGIRSARQGGFYVRDAGESHGDSMRIEKDVRVVTTITFFLTK